MAKKMYDILSPKMAKKIENKVEEFLGEKPVHRRSTAKPHSYKSKKEKRFPWLEIVIGCVVIIVLLGIFAFVKLPKADVEIWPKTNQVSFQEKITADKSVEQVDQEGKVIPAIAVEEQKTSSQDFPTTGSSSDGGKAIGTIIVYNKYSPAAPLTLKTGTHFLSDSGKYFVITQKIIVPAMKNGKAGSVSVAVQAQDFGSDYNIAASKFSVPGLSGTAFYYSIWAESTKAMTGGFSGKLKKVSDDDIRIAKDTLTKKLFADAEASLRSKLSADSVLLDSAISKTVVSATPSLKSGSVAEEFTMTAIVKVFALTFKKQDMRDFVMAEIASKVDSSQKFLDKSLNIKYNPDTVNSGNTKLVFDLQVNGQTYQNTDTTDFAQLLQSKSADQVRDFVNQKFNSQVSKIKINFWPFWVSTVPSNQSRVKVNLNFN